MNDRSSSLTVLAAALPSLPEEYVAFYPASSIEEAHLTRATASFHRRASSLAHFGAWAVLLASTFEGTYRQQSVERAPGANAGDSASIAIVPARR